MRDHVTLYHVNTSCQLAYLLSFDLMAVKRNVRPIVLKKMLSTEFRSTTRIFLEEQKALWVRLKVAV